MATRESMGATNRGLTYIEGLRTPVHKALAEAYNSTVRYAAPFTPAEKDEISWNVLSAFEIDVISDPEGAYEILQMLGVVD